MKTLLYASIIMALPSILDAQILGRDNQFPLVNQIRWDMSKENILYLCGAEKVNTAGNDTTITFDSRFLGGEAKVFVRFKNKGESPWGIDVKFKEPTEKLLDTLINHFTHTTGEAPRTAAKEKNLILITMRMEIALWKTKTENIRLLVGKQGRSIFDINLSLTPASL